MDQNDLVVQITWDPVYGAGESFVIILDRLDTLEMQGTGIVDAGFKQIFDRIWAGRGVVETVRQSTILIIDKVRLGHAVDYGEVAKGRGC